MYSILIVHSCWVHVYTFLSVYRSQESSNSSRLSTSKPNTRLENSPCNNYWDSVLISLGLRNRASTVCLRCDRLRNNGQFTCGRCGDVYWTKPVVSASGSDAETAGTTSQHSKKRKAALDPNWNIPTEPGQLCNYVYM